jgi:predicted membrane metal-binding protein
VHLALIKYSVMRLALFVASLVLLWAVGVRQSILMLVLAAAISLALSYVLLRRQRDDLARAIAERTQARLDRHPGFAQADADAEDAAIDAGTAGREDDAADPPP